MRKKQSYKAKYGNDKLYTTLQREASYASVAARRKKKIAALEAALAATNP